MSTEPITIAQLKAAVVRHAGEDPAFRADLLADPKAAVAGLLTTDLPAQVTIRVVEEAPDTHVVVLPAPASGELSDADLESVAGGAAKNDLEGRRTAQLLASAAFGGPILGAGPTVLGLLVRGSGETETGTKIFNAGMSVVTCNA